jgi:hypothetical protein
LFLIYLLLLNIERKKNMTGYKKTILSGITFILISVPLYSQKAIDPKRTSEKGVQFGQQRRYDDALKEFDNAIKYYNINSSKTYHNKGWVFELKGDIPNAITAYEEAVKRNPDQIPTLERVGYLYFQTGRYDEAVITGERVINLDPKNTEVLKWLAEAYALRLQKQREMLLAKEEEKKKENEKKPAKEEPEKEPPPRYIYATYDFMIRTAYYFRDGEEDKGYTYKKTPNSFVNVPEMLRIIATPTKMFEFNFEMGRPFLGAVTPNVIVHTEKLEAIVHLGNYTLGLGGMLNHHKSSISYADGESRSLHDFKTGFILGFRQDDAELMFKIYPRALPRDGSSSSGKTLDVDWARLDYNYKIDKLLNFYSWLSVHDFFFFDHTAEISNYWGVYELGFGVSLGKYNNISKYIKYLSVSVDYTQRFYMMDVNNDRPYKFANGQGLFGINADKWFKGDPFSGYRSTSYVLSPRVEEGIAENYFLYQKIIVEIVDRKEDHDEYNIQFGVGGFY